MADLLALRLALRLARYPLPRTWRVVVSESGASDEALLDLVVKASRRERLLSAVFALLVAVALACVVYVAATLAAAAASAIVLATLVLGVLWVPSVERGPSGSARIRYLGGRYRDVPLSGVRVGVSRARFQHFECVWLRSNGASDDPLDLIPFEH